MANEEKQIQETSLAVKEPVKALPVEQATAALIKYGGFGIVETTIDGAQNLNPEKKARKKIFLTEDAKKGRAYCTETAVSEHYRPAYFI